MFQITSNLLSTWSLGVTLTLCIFLPSTVAQAREIPEDVQHKIDNFINNYYLPQAKISSMGLSIVRNNSEILYTTGYGQANHEKGIPVGNQTQFLIASITKSFTSVIVIKVLHERFPELGEAVLDTPIGKLIPTANFTLVDRYRSEHTTFRDLLAHRTCIVNDNLQLLGEPFSTSSELFYRQRYAEEACGFRSKLEYSNPMYVVAGEVIALLANTTYTKLVHNLLSDIGMHDSSLTSKLDDFSKLRSRAQPYYVVNNTSHPLNPELVKRVVVSNAAGGLFAPPNDMAKYMRFLLNKGSIDKKEIIPASAMAWLTTPSTSFPHLLKYKEAESDRVLTGFSYGLGLLLGSYDGWQQVTHSGYFSPYASLMSLFPSQQLGIFTSVNEGPARMSFGALHNFIFDILRGAEGATEKGLKFLETEKMTTEKNDMLTCNMYAKFIEKYRNETKPQEVNDLVGIYGSGRSGEIHISKRYNPQKNLTGLYLSYGKWYHGWLEYVGGSIYYVRWNTDVMKSDYYVTEQKGVNEFVQLQNGTLDFVVPLPNGGQQTVATFKLGVNLTNLPTIPWSSDSC